MFIQQKKIAVIDKSYDNGTYQVKLKSSKSLRLFKNKNCLPQDKQQVQ